MRAIYWRRKYKNKQEKSPWYLLTNLGDLATAVEAYKHRWGIEAMFKDCKTGGYNLEGSKASPDRLVRLVLLIALAMTMAWLQGEKKTVLWENLLIFVGQKKRGELGEDIAIFGLVCMVRTG